ncbi:hypothetical protein [Mucilaginibacter sp.]|uniref:hypothetical protein n=1 Tax=Mucilaginibacter sp. TaxID=1882438 RepID=UPI0035BBB67F
MKKFIILLLLTATANLTRAQQLNIGTYNLRYANKGDSTAGNGWGQRLPHIAKLVLFQDLDIFGTQEAKFHQLNELTDSLPGYKWFGAGRDDGQHAGEHSAIFYKAAKFSVLKSGNFWMSTVTDKPNKGWDAALPRICTWVQFKELKTSFTFYFLTSTWIISALWPAAKARSWCWKKSGKWPVKCQPSLRVISTSIKHQTVTR